MPLQTNAYVLAVINMTILTIILWLLLGIVVSGVLQKMKDFHTFPYISRQYPWAIRGFTFVLCIFLAWIISFWLKWDWLMPIAIYAFSQTAFIHIYRPLSRRGPSGALSH